MRKSAIVGALVLLILFQGVAWAQRVDPDRIQLALVETYIHFFTVQQVFEQCGAISPEQQQAFQKAFSVWEERNQSDWLFIKKSLAKHLEARPTEYKELVDAAPGIAREEHLASPYTREMCMTVLSSDVRFWDYSVKFRGQLKVLEATFGRERPKSSVTDSTTSSSVTLSTIGTRKASPPVRASGLWEFSVEGLPFGGSKMCVQSEKDRLIEDDVWSKFDKECDLLSETREGNKYSVDAMCKGQTKVSARFEGDYAAKYTCVIKTSFIVNDKMESQQFALRAKRLGECPPDIPPGTRKTDTGILLKGFYDKRQ